MVKRFHTPRAADENAANFLAQELGGSGEIGRAACDSITSARAEATNDEDTNPFLIRIKRLEHEATLFCEQIRIRDQRMGRIAAQRRPHYTPVERMEILEPRAMRGWSLRQTADAFLVAPATVASWMKRADEVAPHALIELREPLNKFPEFVCYGGGNGYGSSLSFLGPRRLA